MRQKEMGWATFIGVYVGTVVLIVALFYVKWLAAIAGFIALGLIVLSLVWTTIEMRRR